jgi:hypothetical protein
LFTISSNDISDEVIISATRDGLIGGLVVTAMSDRRLTDLRGSGFGWLAKAATFEI